jgi:hypothetical protein
MTQADDNLTQLNIIPNERGLYLKLKSDFAERATLSRNLGKGNLWSSNNFHSHLEILQNHVPNVVSQCYVSQSHMTCDSCHTSTE